MEVRTLRPEEHEAWLELLDGWDLADGWRGRDFFRRFIEFDPTWAEENVFVAEESGRLVSTAQIFPRRIRLANRTASLGGIGSVFTREDARGRGAARAVLGHCVEAMRARGMDLSLLFTGRISFYAELGWRSWGVQCTALERIGVTRPAPGPADLFVEDRDRAEACALHQAYDAGRSGTVVRDEALWTMSLRVSGNPAEEFRVARRDGRLVAYARAIVLYRVFVIMELARTAQDAGALADLLLALQTPREEDPFATPERPSSEVRRVAITPNLSADPSLEAALSERGVLLRRHPDPSLMLLCLDAPRLAERIRTPMEEGESPNDYLQRVLPADPFIFWPADRF